MTTPSVVERVARALYRADVIDGNEARKISGDDLNLANVDLDKWFDTNATMPLSGQPFLRRWNALAEAAITALQATPAAPIPMLLFCPRCGSQHIDAPDGRTPDWDNPPHKSHLCHGCGTIWRPADVPTEGVAAIQTRGSKDTIFYDRAALPEPPVQVIRSKDLSDEDLEAIRNARPPVGGGL